MSQYQTTTKGVRFFSDHYSRVNEERKKRGMLTRSEVLGPNNGEVKDHPWLGRKYRIDGRGDVFTVDQVYRQWYLGWHTRIFSLVNDTKSHAEHVIEAEGCQCWVLRDGAEQFARKAKFISA